MIAHVPAASHTLLRPYAPGQTFLRIDHVAKSFVRGATSSEVLADIDVLVDDLVRRPARAPESVR